MPQIKFVMPTDVETFSVNRETAAQICGVPDSQLRGWLNANNLFYEKQDGRGHHAHFRLVDLMKIRAVAELVASGLSVRQACDALRPYALLNPCLLQG